MISYLPAIVCVIVSMSPIVYLIYEYKKTAFTGDKNND